MKKILLLTFAFAAMNIFAATPTAMVKLLVNSSSSISGDNIMMAESSAWSSGKDNGADGPKNLIAGNLQMWVPTSFGDMATLGTDNLEGTPITIQTINDEEYTFSFSNVSGRALKFYDAVLDSLIDITNTNVYVCQLEKNTTIANRFSIYKPFSGDEGELDICYQYGDLTINNNPYTTNIVVKDEDGQVVLDKMARTTPQVIDLSSLEKGAMYQVIVGDKTMIIRVQ